MSNVYDLVFSINQKQEVSTIVEFNKKTEQFGLSLTEEEAAELVQCKNDSLKKYQRVEFGKSILEKIMYVFCDSSYIHSDRYLETLERLQDIFFLYKNESADELTDDELLNFMKEQFEGVCYGDIEYLEGTCLQIFCEAVRAGYKGYIGSEGHGEYEKFDEVKRWDKDMYMQVLRELFWE